MHAPRRHFAPLCQFEAPYLGQNLRISRADLGHILGKFWAYLEVEALERPESLDILAIWQIGITLISEGVG